MPKPDAFIEGSETFINYKERLDAHLTAHDVAAAKHTAVLLSSIGAKTYGILRSLTAPDLPSEKSYQELCAILQKHFSPAPLEIVERFKFHKRNQGQGETIAEYIAAIKRLSQHCNFGDNLQDALRDRFVCGLKDEATQKRLLQEPTLTFDKATAMAQAIETAHRDAAEIHGHGTIQDSVHKLSKSHHHNKPKQQTVHPPCQSCGKTNHARSNCFYRQATCKKCSKVGHIQTVCRSTKKNAEPDRKHNSQSKSRQKPVHELEADDQFTLELYTLKSSSPKIMVPVRVNDVKTQMELDTGAAISVMTLGDFRRIFRKDPLLTPTKIKLKTYTNEVITPLGQVQVSVETNGQTASLPLLILEKGSNPIFGRDWLSTFKLAWKDIHSICTSASQAPSDQRIKALISDFSEVFSEGIGTVKGITGNLTLKEEAKPKFCKARTVPYAFKDKVEREIDNLENQGIITKVHSSDWATPIVPVVKSNGDIRICGDFKTTVNPSLDVEQYTLPRMEDMLATLEHGQTFSKIDLRQAYLQLPLDDASRKITTINTSKGLYSYNRLPFGITSSPAIWQRTMDQILSGLPGVQCNQDDMIVTGKTEEDHLKNLRAVLKRLNEYGLKANLTKCKFFQKDVIFCGIKITQDGIHKTEDKIIAIKEAPVPTNKTQLRSFLGLVNYYHKWLDNVAQIAKPLYNQLQDHQQFSWSESCQQSFERIKAMVASDKVLMRYDPDLPLRLATDASPYGLGAVLSHITKDGEERPIAYASRTLNQAEKNYSQLDKEALSIVWAVKKFFNYLCGRHFTLITDHQPLKFIFSPSRGIPAMSAARQQRYAVFLSGFNYSIEYRNSRANANADGLSRLPMPTSTSAAEIDDADRLFYTDILESIPVNSTIAARDSRHDPTLSKVIHFVQTDTWPSNVHQELQPFFSRRHELTVQHNCLLWGYRLVPPQRLRSKILDMLHQGHLGIVKMKNMARGYFWWPGMDKNIEELSKSCDGCARSQPDPLKAPLHPWNWPEKPWQRIHIDYAGPFLGSMFLVIVDAHSKWAEIIPTSSATSASSICILTSLFARFGLPEHLVSDNGPQFTSEEFSSFLRSNGVKHIFSPPYHPATNGLAERMVKTFKQAMKSAKNDKGNLNTKLARFLFAYRNAPHSTTSESPSSLMFGRHLRNHMDIMRPDLSRTVSLSQQRQVNAHSQAKQRHFSVGDTVLVRDYRGNQRWLHGTIGARNGSHTYDVEIAGGITWRRHADQMVHTRTQPDTKSDTHPMLLPPPVPSFSTTSAAVDTNDFNQTQLPQGGRDGTSTRPQVEPPCSPNRDESQNSPSLLDQRSGAHPDTQNTHKTRSGRVVRKPVKYTL